MVAVTASRFTELAERPSLRRIAGMSSAMALHVVVFAILLMPVAIPIATDPLKPKPKDNPDWVEIPPEVIKPVPPMPVAPVVPVRRTPPPPVPVVDTPVLPQVVDAPFVEVVAPPTPPVPEVAEAAFVPGVPVEAGSLAYRFAPPPHYPPAARRKGWHGTVILRVLVDERGLPMQVQIARSSGRALLDVTAAKQVRTWRFHPEMRNGVAMKAWASVPVAFSLSTR